MPGDSRDPYGVLGSTAQSWLHTHPGTMTVFLLAGMTVVGAGIKLAAPVLIPLLLGVLIAMVSMPLVHWLGRVGAPRLIAVSCAVAANVLVLIGLGSLVTTSVGRLSAKLPAYSDAVMRAGANLSGWLQRINPNLHLPDIIDPSVIGRTVTALLGEFAGFLTNLTLAVILAAFLMFDLARVRKGERGIPGTSERVRRAIREVNKYVAIKTGVSMVTGLLVAGWLKVCGGELPVLFGLLAFGLNYIPNVGSIAASIPAIALALLQDGAGAAVLVAGGYLVINVTIGNVVEPRVMGRALGLSPVVVILSVILWGWLLGPTGALLSALLTVLVKLGLSSAEDLRPFAYLLGPSPPRSTSPSQVDEELVEIVVPQSVGERRPRQK